MICKFVDWMMRWWSRVNNNLYRVILKTVKVRSDHAIASWSNLFILENRWNEIKILSARVNHLRPKSHRHVVLVIPIRANVSSCTYVPRSWGCSRSTDRFKKLFEDLKSVLATDLFLSALLQNDDIKITLEKPVSKDRFLLLL